MRTLSTSEIVLTATKEDYLRAVYLLQVGQSSVTVTQIAKRLHLSKSTVSERIKELVRDGFVISEVYGQVTLSKKGDQVAQNLTYKHRLIEVFLHQILKVPKTQIHNEAEKLEHALSDNVTKRLAKFLNYPKADPHGSPISKSP